MSIEINIGLLTPPVIDSKKIENAGKVLQLEEFTETTV